MRNALPLFNHEQPGILYLEDDFFFFVDERKEKTKKHSKQSSKKQTSRLGGPWIHERER